MKTGNLKGHDKRQRHVRKSIHNGFFNPILFYHLKKLFYQLYHTILQYPQHLETLFFFPILFKYSFLIFFLLFLFFSSFSSLSPSTSSKLIPSKITSSKPQQKITQIKQAPEIHLPPQQNHKKKKSIRKTRLQPRPLPLAIGHNRGKTHTHTHTHTHRT